MDIKTIKILQDIKKTMGLDSVQSKISNYQNNRPIINDIAINDTDFSLWQYIETEAFTPEYISCPPTQEIEAMKRTSNTYTGNKVRIVGIWNRVTPSIVPYLNSIYSHSELGQYNSTPISRSFSLGHWSETESTTTNKLLGDTLGVIGTGDSSARETGIAFSNKGELLTNSILKPIASAQYDEPTFTLSLDENDKYLIETDEPNTIINMGSQISNSDIGWNKTIYIKTTSTAAKFVINLVDDVSVQIPKENIHTNMLTAELNGTYMLNMPIVLTAIMVIEIERMIIGGVNKFLISGKTIADFNLSDFNDLSWDNKFVDDDEDITSRLGRFSLGRFGDDPALTDKFLGNTLGIIGSGTESVRSTKNAFSDKGEFLTNGILYDKYEYYGLAQATNLKENDMTVINAGTSLQPYHYISLQDLNLDIPFQKMVIVKNTSNYAIYNDTTCIFNQIGEDPVTNTLSNVTLLLDTTKWTMITITNIGIINGGTYPEIFITESPFHSFTA